MKLNDYQTYIHLSRYARFLESEQRRETWKETVWRYVNFLDSHLRTNYKFSLGWLMKRKIFKFIYNLKTMPSMRMLMTAGKALETNHVAGFNCSYIPIIGPFCFSEILFVLMSGTGVGFSVERDNIKLLPAVPSELKEITDVIQVQDSREGWAIALSLLISSLYNGKIIRYNTDQIRPAGSRLKTFSGRASGPEPLIDLFEFTIDLFKSAQGRRFTSIEVFDLVCKIASIVVVGGVRRSSLICLFDKSDRKMLSAKKGEFWIDHPYRSMANISAVFSEKPTKFQFDYFWKYIQQSGTGEPGIFNRQAAIEKSVKLGRPMANYGINPCAEIILLPFSFCNLTEVVVRSSDSKKSIKKKAELASILGTIQSTLTNFPFIRSKWKKNAEQERLLGVSLTGIHDNKLTYQPKEEFLTELNQLVQKVNKKWAKKLGINPSVARTCIKPSGTVSQLVDCSSGLHQRIFEYYYRTVRNDKKDPLSQFLKDQRIYHEDCLMSPNQVDVFYFPMKAKKHTDFSAIEQLELWKKYQTFYCDHNPSCTIYIKSNEWETVREWVWKNFDHLLGVSFLPLDDHIYKQAPYIRLTKEEYEKQIQNFPQIEWEKFKENEDNTTVFSEFTCTGDKCEFQI